MADKTIKYDVRTLKILFVTTLFSAFMAVAGFYCMAYEVRGIGLEIMILGFLFAGIFLYAGVNFLMGLSYLHRLKVYGYEIPRKREDYGNDLRNVPCLGRTTSRSEGKDRGSMVLCLLYAAVFLLVNTWNIRYFIEYHRLIDNSAEIFLVIMLLFDLFWAIYAVKFYRQGNLQKYRDDVEIDENRKERTPFEKGLLDCAIIFGIISVSKFLIAGLSGYMLQARIDHDSEYLLLISDSVGAVMAEEGTGNDFDSYRQMCEGCYITDWDEPEDAFAQKIAAYIGISVFSQLEEKIYTSDGRPRIYVKIIGERVLVRMKNPRLPVNNRFGFD